MIFGVYCIRDRKTGFMSPSIDLNDAAAIRNFEHACQQTSSLMYSHSGDYDLHKLGVFDSDTGYIDAHNSEVIASGYDFKKEV